jgi:S-formylglutathione hydrolase FrmB
MNGAQIKARSESSQYGGWLVFYTHDARETRRAMNFAVYELPTTVQNVRAVYYLVGLTCTTEMYFIKADALGPTAGLSWVP